MDYERARAVMVQRQLQGRDIKDPRILEAMRHIPRERFVDIEYRDLAHRDIALPIGEDQTISQPYVVALMTTALAMWPGDRILEIGTGSGYQAAVLAEMGAEVFTIERHPSLAHRAQQLLDDLDYDVNVRSGDGSAGWPEEAPFDGILVTAGAPTIPNPLLEQLRVNRHLIIPVFDRRVGQVLVRITKRPEGRFERRELANVRFVPLIGEEGWHPGQNRP